MQGVLPHLTAGLNALALVLACAGFVLVRSGRKELHRRVMIGAVATSAAFLVVYVVHHFSHPLFAFRGAGLARPVYFSLLFSHVALAVAVTPMILLTLRRALRGEFRPHRALARWTLPVWVYVSASGIVVYALLYHVYV
jgi:uncharacterized membrane protein YozB (DUF420 family)